MAAHLIAWGALAVLCYAYLCYPVLLAVVVRARRPAPLQRGDARPSITVVLAAWNEASMIAAKIENTLSQHYPPDILDMIVVSDASTDGTDEVVAVYESRTGRVSLLRAEARQGKSAALNLGVPTARGEIVVLTDANAAFEPDAIAQLVKPFADPRVGAVSGQLRYRTSGGLDEGEGAYWRYEQRIKQLESSICSLLGANGSIYAIRRDLFRPLRALDVNDFRIPYEVLLQGRLVVLEPAARSYEAPAPSLWAEYRRKVRIMSRAIPTMLPLLGRTVARGRIALLWQLISHKVLREMQAVFFAGMLVGAGWGAALGDGALSLFFAAQVSLYLLGAVAWAFPNALPRIFRLAAHFDMIALASFAALALWLTGRARATWQPARNAQG